MTVALRHAWQTFPTAFRIRDGGVSVQFWPTEGERLSFMPEGIMPSDFYNAERVWRRFWWSRDAGHYTNEYARRRTGKGGTIPNKYFVYTAEGAARTHELAIFFHDESSKRTPAQINSVTQHPVILRQDPSSAMRVPFMGFRLMPVQRDKYPNIERAVDLLGRMSMARRVPQHNFGLLRFGMILWGRPLHPNNSLYRWMDNLQYDQQLVPWLLFLRGGDRRLYEDGEITARYAMDVNVNHYNTRGYPPGNCATCGGGLPFPFIEMCIWNQKGVKIHYLSYYYHLTGYRRAKEVMDEVIAGQKEFTLKVSDTPEERHSTAREIYNMNVFWVNAYEETFDPEIGKLCRESMRITAEREYNRELNAHRHPQVYLYNGLVLQHRQWQDEALRETMLRDLSADLLPIVGEGGIHSVTDLIGCGWAYEQTGNKGYATAGWDVARALADLTPDADFASGIPLDGCINGSGLYRGFLLPILVGASLGDRLGLTTEQPTHLTGTFFFLSPEAPRSRDVKLTAYVRPRRRGDLKLSIHCRTAPAAPVEGQALDPTGREVLSTALEAPEVRPSERFYPRNRLSADREVTLPDAHQGAVYRLEFHGKGRPLLRVAGDADIVYRFPDTPQHACAPLSGGQRYTGYQLVTRTTKDVVTFETTDNIFHRPHVIRDAKTGELLHRYALSDPLKRQHRLGKGRMIRILLAGARGNRAWSIDGVSPYFSSTLNEWFDPDED